MNPDDTPFEAPKMEPTPGVPEWVALLFGASVSLAGFAVLALWVLR